MKKIKTIATLAIITAAFAATSVVRANDLLPPKIKANLTVVSEARPPIGWVQFCAEEPMECRVRTLHNVNMDGPLILNYAAWDDLQAVNTRVNRQIIPMTDQEHYGVEEKWTFARDGRGDCEDYVLEKRKLLHELGYPLSSLLITVVRDKKGDGHAVLLVRTNRGDLVLDNQNDQILHAQDTPYRFIKRQAEHNPNMWVSFAASTGADAPITSNRLNGR